MKYLLLPLLLLASCSVYFEPEFNLSNETRVFDAIDGDTLLLYGGEIVRIIGIDAPEKGSEKYHEATDFLRNLTEGKVVRLEIEGESRDKYGRLLRHVFINEINIGSELLANDFAVVYPNYDGYLRSEYVNLSS